MSTELKACPFCGSSPHMHEWSAPSPDRDGFWAVYCGLCNVTGPKGTTQEDAATRWNNRGTILASPSYPEKKSLSHADIEKELFGRLHQTDTSNLPFWALFILGKKISYSGTTGNCTADSVMYEVQDLTNDQLVRTITIGDIIDKFNPKKEKAVPDDFHHF